MMSNTRPLSTRQLRDIQTISEISADVLKSAVRNACDVDDSVRKKALLDALKATLPESAAEAVFRWAYHTRAAQWGINDSRGGIEILNVISRRAEAQSVSIGNEHIAAIADLAESSQMYALHNAQRLAYIGDQVYDNSEILVDIRPVYNKGRDNVVGEVVLASLRLTYRENDEDKTATILMDSLDIDTMTMELDRARKKLEILRENADPQFRFVAGEEDIRDV